MTCYKLMGLVSISLVATSVVPMIIASMMCNGGPLAYLHDRTLSPEVFVYWLLLMVGAWSMFAYVAWRIL